MKRNTKKLVHGGYVLFLERREVKRKVQVSRFETNTPQHNNGNYSVRSSYEYFIPNWQHDYNTGRTLKDYKYMIENLHQYEWLKPFITVSPY